MRAIEMVKKRHMRKETERKKIFAITRFLSRIRGANEDKKDKHASRKSKRKSLATFGEPRIESLVDAIMSRDERYAVYAFEFESIDAEEKLRNATVTMLSKVRRSVCSDEIRRKISCYYMIPLVSFNYVRDASHAFVFPFVTECSSPIYRSKGKSIVWLLRYTMS